MWPLSFWLPTTYTAAAPPVAAVFAIMSKVGIYVVLRLSLLLFAHGEEPAQFGSEWLLYGGMATIAFGMVGVLAAQEIGRASCRERVCQYVEISVVAVSLKKKNTSYSHDAEKDLKTN